MPLPERNFAVDQTPLVAAVDRWIAEEPHRSLLILLDECDAFLDSDAKDHFRGSRLLKGIMDPEDAELAVASGADALIVSNHGGRQLDGTISSIAALPSIAAAVGDRIEVFMDGGVRGGQDVLKALALGAKAVFIGRAYIYGLGAMGHAGVAKALECIRKELDVSTALCGLTDVRRAGAHNLVRHG